MEDDGNAPVTGDATGADHPEGPDYPDGSVGRYVRERWGALPSDTGHRPAPGRVDKKADQPTDRAAPADPPFGENGSRAAGVGGPGCGETTVPAEESRSRSGAPDAAGTVDPAGMGPAGMDPAEMDGVAAGPAARIPEQATPPDTAGQRAERPGRAVAAVRGSNGSADGAVPAARSTRVTSATSTATDPRTPESGIPESGLSTSGPPPSGSARRGTRPAQEPSPTPAAPAGSGTRDTPRRTDPGGAQESQLGRNGVDLPPADLSSARLLRPSKRPPQSGWRRLVYVLSGRFINPGESPADVRRRELTVRVNKPLLGCHKIAMLSLKGGVGKTTTTATLGSMFASQRGDRVVAVDANPDRGTLSQKIPLETSATVRHLLRDAQRVRRYTDVRAYTSQGQSRLEVLASEQDPAVSEAFSEDDYRRTVTLLEHFYNIVLTDCGTGLMHSAMYGVLGVADQLIIVSSGSIDGARSASATMDWLDAHGHQELVRSAVAVINCVHRSAGGVDLDRVAEHFAARCRAVVRIPFDAHLGEGAEIDLDRLEPATRLALLELAAAVADDFPS